MAGTSGGHVNIPVGLVAEVTHRCPMRCLYCSNPTELVRREQELSTDEWLSVLEQAAELGVLQVHFSGGEPLQRPDLQVILRRAAELELFTNLITSGIGLTRGMVQFLSDIELGSFQLSLQGSDEEMVREVGGGPFWRKKMEAAAMVREAGLSLSLNVVLHSRNLHQAGQIIDLANSLGADRLELANTQYYGWALANRQFLMPSREQLALASAEVEDRRKLYGDSMEILWVIPDYYDDFPKACTGGWGSAILSVAPDGRVLPCLAAYVLPDIELASIRDHTLRWIWYDSPAFERYRGDDWMVEPCRNCPMRVQDGGGCRCQAYLLTGDARNTDPVCIYSPHHDIVVSARSSTRSSVARRPEALPRYRMYAAGREPVDGVAEPLG